MAKDTYINVRFGAKELAYLDRLATAAKRTRSDTIRLIVEAMAQRDAPAANSQRRELITNLSQRTAFTAADLEAMNDQQLEKLRQSLTGLGIDEEVMVMPSLAGPGDLTMTQRGGRH